jgi:hypothetical protein
MQLAEANALLRAENEQLQGQLLTLRHQLAQLQRLVFGRKSECFVPDGAMAGQPTLFSALEVPVAVAEAEKESIAYERKKGKGAERPHPGRNELPASLPRQEVVIEPANDQIKVMFDELGADAVLTVTDIAGNVKLTRNIDGGQGYLMLDISDWGRGMWLLHVQGQHLRQTAKFTIIR